MESPSNPQIDRLPSTAESTSLLVLQVQLSSQHTPAELLAAPLQEADMPPVDLFQPMIVVSEVKKRGRERGNHVSWGSSQP